MNQGRRAILLSLPALAGARVAGAQQPAPAAAIPGRDMHGDLLSRMEAYIAERGLRTRPELSAQIGTADVAVPMGDRNWVNARVIAFNEAMARAQAAAIRSLNSSIRNETMTRLFQAADLTPPPLPTGALDRADAVADMARRLIGVARGRLDAELRELGIDPAAFERQPEPQRHLQLQRAFRSRTTIQAFGSLSGFQPAATFETNNESGRFSIGVVLVGSLRSRDVAAQIAGRRPFTPDPSRADNPDALLADQKLLIDDFGVRLRYDAQGLPVLLSFGQWGATPAGMGTLAMQMARDVAMRQAELLADEQIARFIRSSAQFESQGEVGQQIEQAANRLGPELVEQQDETVRFVNGLNDVLQRRTDVQNLAGLTTRLTWVQPHPVANVPIYGVVRSWSAAAEADARAFRDGRRPPPAAAPAQPSSPAGVRQGRDMLNPRDF